MKRTGAGVAAGLAGALGAVGCASFVKEPIPAPDTAFLALAQQRGLDTQAVVRGHDQYPSACGHCHYPVHPARRTAAQWETIMPTMVHKARLDDAAAADIRAYVDAVLAQPPYPIPK